MITSTSNPKIKELRKLRERKGRQDSGNFIIEGLHIVAEAIQHKASFDSIIIAPDLLRSQFGYDLIERQRGVGVDVIEVTAPVFKTISSKDGPQGIIGVVKQSWSDISELNQPQPTSLWVALDAVQDPGNLGTIMRTLDAVGGQGVILLDHCVDPYDPTAVRAGMGAIFNLNLIKMRFPDFQEWKRKSGLPLIGTSGKSAKDYHVAKYPQRLVLLMGSERQGLLDHHLQLCDMVVSIPMVGSSDSLNLAVATAVVLYEIYNYRREGD